MSDDNTLKKMDEIGAESTAIGGRPRDPIVPVVPVVPVDSTNKSTKNNIGVIILFVVLGLLMTGLLIGIIRFAMKQQNKSPGGYKNMV